MHVFLWTFGLSAIPYFGGLRLWGRAAEEKTAQGFGVEWEQGPKIAEAAKGGGGCHGEKNQRQAD